MRPFILFSLLAAIGLSLALSGCKRPGQPPAAVVPSLPAPNGSPANVAHIPHVVYEFRAGMPIRHAQTLEIGSVILNEPFPKP